MTDPSPLSIGKDVLLALIAVYGAALSTFNYLDSRKKDRRRVLVSFNTAIPNYAGKLGATFAKIEVVNAGHRPVTITHIALEIPDKHRLFSAGEGMPAMPDTKLPITLSDGGAAHMSLAYKDIGEALLSRGYQQEVSIIPICIDSLDTTHRGKGVKISPREFVGM